MKKAINLIMYSVLLADLSPIDLSGTEITVSMWIKIPNYDNIEGRILSQATGTNANDHVVMISQNGGSALRFRLNTDGATTTLISNTGEITLDTWIFVTAIYDGSSMKILKNTNEIISTAKTGYIISSTALIGIGNQPTGGGNRPFLGQIDDVRIYNKGLSPEEITALNNNTCGQYLLLKDMVLDDNSFYSSNQLIELNNVMIPVGSTVILQSENIEISSNSIIGNGVNLYIEYSVGCND